MEIKTIVDPIHDRIVVRRKTEAEMTKGGIIIPETAQEKPHEGVVVAVGSGYVLESGAVRPMAIKPGDRVLFGKYAGNDITVDGQQLTIMREEEVMAILRSKEAD